MNLPNALTLLRIFFVPVLVAALLQEDLQFHVGELRVTNEFLALAVFLISAATDLLDGYLARKWHQITTVGMLLDPIADKLLISSALIALVQVDVAPAWMTILIIGREFAVSGLRAIAASEGYVIRASDLGKTKLVTQVVAISLLILSIHWTETRPWALLWLWGVVFFSLLSAGMYFVKFWRTVDDRIKTRRRRELILLERQRRKQARRQRRADRIPHSAREQR